jgi:hypothetical protein
MPNLNTPVSLAGLRGGAARLSSRRTPRGDRRTATSGVIAVRAAAGW